MTKDERYTAYEAFFKTFGRDMQITICIEELSKLTKELCKHKRGKDNWHNILEELADVFICVEEMQYLFRFPDDVMDKTIDSKIERGLKRIPNYSTLNCSISTTIDEVVGWITEKYDCKVNYNYNHNAHWYYLFIHFVSETVVKVDFPEISLSKPGNFRAVLIEEIEKRRMIK